MRPDGYWKFNTSAIPWDTILNYGFLGLRIMICFVKVRCFAKAEQSGSGTHRGLPGSSTGSSTRAAIAESAATLKLEQFQQ
jgi:hypothetical protein